MAKYKKADNCGPVPYPDRSGRMLNAGDVVEGDEWESLMALGYVVKVVEPPAPEKKPEKKVEKASPVVVAVAEVPSAQPVVGALVVEAEVASEVTPLADVAVESSGDSTDIAKGVDDGLQPVNDGAGVKEVDTPEARKSSDQGVSGRTTGRRRR